ncbi:MAG: sensor histidine kinase [Prevotellaceae bacterium]|jgi:signal transduction histidine kinase|nr:sensor histidine kinase [Prevotellaceae bacterium]
MNRRIFYIIISAFLLTFSTCRKDDRQGLSETTSALIKLDSMVNSMRNVDTLTVWAERYEQQKKYAEAERVLRKLGNVSRESDNYIKALEYHNRALSLAQELNNTTEIILCLNQIGTDYRRMGSYEDASSYHYRALQLCETYSDKTSDFALKNKVISLNGIGNIYLTLGNLTEAFEVFKEALDGETRLGSHLGMAINYANIGAIYEQRQMYDSAHIYYEYSMEHNKRATSKLGISLCHGHFGRLAEIAGNLDEALQEYRAAYEIMENSTDRWHWMDACVSLIRVNIAKGNMYAAKTYLDKAEATARNIRSKDYFALVYQMKYMYHEKQGNMRQALDNYILSSTYNDSIINLKNVNHINNMRIRYETEKNSIKITSLEDEKNSIKIISIIAIALLLSTVGVLFALYMYMRQKKQLAEQQIMLFEKEKQLIATQAVLDGETAERSRIAQDLHDGLGSMLTGVKLNMNELKKGATLEYSSIEQFNKALILLDDSMRELRRVAHHLMPESLSRYGLKVALTDFCDSIPNAEFNHFGSEKRLNKKIEVMIYRIMHELINNAMKHSGASRILVQIVQNEDNIIFTVEDNGCGFDLDAATKGMGLKNIKSRIASFGGIIDIRSRQNKGTEVNVELKINQENI